VQNGKRKVIHIDKNLYVCNWKIKRNNHLLTNFKMNNIYRKTSICLVSGILFFIVIFSGVRSFAQVHPADDPNLDQVPRYLRENFPAYDHAPLSTVITVDNWDNFNLGVDLAENNIAASLQNPAWHFLAYNINAGHHTEDGLNYANVVPNFGVSLAGDPVVAYDSIGNLYYINLFSASSIEGIKVIKSTDNGATWGSAVTGASGNDKCWIACDQTNGPYTNYVYVCMTNNGQGSFARSTDNGATFTTTFTPGTQSLPGMSVCVGAYNDIQGGAVYCVTNSGSTFNSIYTFYRSLDGGENFTLMSSQQFANTVGTQLNNRHSVQGMRTRPYPYIAADNSFGPHRGRLYNVYASNDPPGNGNKPDIWLRYSDDGGGTFSPAIRVNDDPNTQANHQWHPAVWCDKQTGRIYLNWMDTRDTPTSDSAYIYATYSDDGGVTFAPNQRISNKKMKIDCSTCGGSGSPRYQGDYNGIVSNIKGSLSGWTDFRDGNFMSTTGYFPDFAMALDHNSDTIYAGSDSTDFTVSIPGVKLYSDTVLLTCEIVPVPSGGSVIISFPQGNMITTYPDSRIIHLKSVGAVPPGDYQVVFTAAGPNGTPVHRRNATLNIINPDFIILNATASPSSICQGASTQLLADANGGTPPYTYSWTSNPAGFSSNIANPVASPLVNTWFIVTVSDNASNSSVDSVLVTISPVPEMPGPITGPTETCSESPAIFSIAPVFGATSYSWTVPPDVGIINGQNTTNLAVQWGSTPGTVSVIAGNNCGNSNPSVLAVSVIEKPVAPGTISGPSLVCSNANVYFSIAEVPGAESYLWTTSLGATIVSGQGTTTININWGENPGSVSVIAQNSCGSSPQTTKEIGIETLPAAAGVISGKDTVCKGQNGYQYSVPEITGAVTYSWTVPTGSMIIGNDTGQVIIVDFSMEAVSGDITVKGHNTCGDGGESIKTVTANPCTGISENKPARNASVYPNPASGQLYISVKSQVKELKLVLTDMNGRELYMESFKNTGPGFTARLDISGYAKGLYFLRLITDEDFYTEKVLIQ
jgi:hypothetical protein